MQGFLSDLGREISDATGAAFVARSYRPVSGGCINQTLLLSDDADCQQTYFVKYNDRSAMTMFENEFTAMVALAKTRTIAVPRPLCCGQSGNRAFLVLEYIKSGSGDAAAHQKLGRQLAALHQFSHQADAETGAIGQFGWHVDNTIGATRQVNQYSDDWAAFWQQHRLGYQFSLAEKNGYLSGLKHSEKVLAAVPEILGSRVFKPSLLHGDLWSGNYMFDEAGTAFIFDPASYYGDPETDIAMTELFGGFTSSFYAAYRECIPEAPGYSQRRTLYNLYHILNHLNLFGSGYLSQAQQMMDEVLLV